MAAGVPNIGQSSTLSYQLGQTGAYVPITNCQSITPPDYVIGNVVKTQLTAQFVQKRLTIPDLGEIAFVVQFDYEDTSHAAMKTLLYTFPQPLTNWKIALPEGTAIVVPGFLTKLTEDELVNEDLFLADGSVLITGPPVYTAGTGG